MYLTLIERNKIEIVIIIHQYVLKKLWIRFDVTQLYAKMYIILSDSVCFHIFISPWHIL